jgi:TupA-like ATPgrasp
VRSLLGGLRRWSRAVRKAKDARWQGRVVRPLVMWIARRRRLSFEGTLRLEWLARSALGQPLALRAWDRMTFNDKVAYRRLRVRDPLLQTFSDKLAMRDYVAERLGPDALPALHAVEEDPAAFADRPGPYVLKANHGSGMVTFVGEGALPSEEQLREAESWLESDYRWYDLEWGYQNARRRLLAEEFLHWPGSLEPPPDYKLFTFGGTVALIQIDSERFTGHRRMLRRPDWSPIAGRFCYPPPEGPDPAPPAALEPMLQLAAALGQGLDFVRVDLYDVDGRVLVGELTAYPEGGKGWFEPASLDTWLGGLWRDRPRAYRR